MNTESPIPPVSTTPTQSISANSKTPLSDVQQVANSVIEYTRTDTFSRADEKPKSSVDQAVKSLGDTYLLVNAAFNDPETKRQIAEAYEKITHKGREANRKITTVISMLEEDWSNVGDQPKAAAIIEILKSPQTDKNPEGFLSPIFKFILGLAKSLGDEDITTKARELESAINSYDGTTPSQTENIQKLRNELADALVNFLKTTSAIYVKTTKALITASPLLKINVEALTKTDYSFQEVVRAMIGLRVDDGSVDQDMQSQLIQNELRELIKVTRPFAGFNKNSNRADLSSFNRSESIEIPQIIESSINFGGDIEKSAFKNGYKQAQAELLDKINSSPSGSISITDSRNGGTVSVQTTDFRGIIGALASEMSYYQNLLSENFATPVSSGSSDYENYKQVIYYAGQIKMVLGLESLRDGVFAGSLPLAKEDLRKDNEADYAKLKPLLNTLNEVNRQYNDIAKEASSFLTPILENIFAETVGLVNIGVLPTDVAPNSIIESKLTAFQTAASKAIQEVSARSTGLTGGEEISEETRDVAGFAFTAVLNSYSTVFGSYKEQIKTTKDEYTNLANTAIKNASESIKNLGGQAA
ncbi:MAG: hypothetical protein SFT81_06915 [Candidatus Caenarcaniphilales bacterium]|nr:hypothetical protein [Candidatus Caenarcaniphilales bacterium]